MLARHMLTTRDPDPRQMTNCLVNVLWAHAYRLLANPSDTVANLPQILHFAKVYIGDTAMQKWQPACAVTFCLFRGRTCTGPHP